MTTVKVKGMSCNHCVAAVVKAMKNIDGIKDIRVDLDTGEVRFHEEKPVDIKLVEEHIKKAGYDIG